MKQPECELNIAILAAIGMKKSKNYHYGPKTKKKLFAVAFFYTYLFSFYLICVQVCMLMCVENFI